MDWIFSHLDDLESMDVSEGGRSEGGSEASREPPPGPRVRDGQGSKCVCVAFIHFFFYILCSLLMIQISPILLS